MRLLTILVLLCLALPVHADDDDQDRARAALARHEIQPLSHILAQVKRLHEGTIVNIEYEDQDGTPTYEFEIVQPSGQVIDLRVDAATGKVLGEGENDSE